MILIPIQALPLLVQAAPGAVGCVIMSLRFDERSNLISIEKK